MACFHLSVLLTLVLDFLSSEKGGGGGRWSIVLWAYWLILGWFGFGWFDGVVCVCFGLVGLWFDLGFCWLLFLW